MAATRDSSQLLSFRGSGSASERDPLHVIATKARVSFDIEVMISSPIGFIAGTSDGEIIQMIIGDDGRIAKVTRRGAAYGTSPIQNILMLNPERAFLIQQDNHAVAFSLLTLEKLERQPEKKKCQIIGVDLAGDYFCIVNGKKLLIMSLTSMKIVKEIQIVYEPKIIQWFGNNFFFAAKKSYMYLDLTQNRCFEVGKYSDSPLMYMVNGEELILSTDAGGVYINIHKQSKSRPNTLWATPNASPVSFLFQFPLLCVLLRTPGNNFLEVHDLVEKIHVQTILCDEDYTGCLREGGRALCFNKSFYLFLEFSADHTSTYLAQTRHQGELFIDFENKIIDTIYEPFFSIPTDDIPVVSLSRNRTEHFMCAQLRAHDTRLPLHVRESMLIFSEKFIFVFRKYSGEDFHLVQLVEKWKLDFQRQEDRRRGVEGPKEELDSLHPMRMQKEEILEPTKAKRPLSLYDPTDEEIQIFEKYDARVEETNISNRLKHRINLLEISPFEIQNSKIKNSRQNPPMEKPFAVNLGNNLNILINEIVVPSFENVLQQPHYMSVCLFDTFTHTIVTEQIHFTVHHSADHKKATIVGAPNGLNIKFERVPSSPTLVLIIRMDSNFHGDVSTTSAPTREAFLFKEKERLKISKRTNENLIALKKFRQNVAWGYAKLPLDPSATHSETRTIEGVAWLRLPNISLTDSLLSTFFSEHEIDQRKKNKIIFGSVILTYNFQNANISENLKISDGDLEAFDEKKNLEEQKENQRLLTQRKEKRNEEGLPSSVHSAFKIVSETQTRAVEKMTHSLSPVTTHDGEDLACWGLPSLRFSSFHASVSPPSSLSPAAGTHTYSAPSETASQKDEPILEGSGFRLKIGNLPEAPNMNLEHILYIYPRSGNFSKLGKREGGHNIAVKIQVKKKDLLSAEDLPIIIGTNGELISEIISSCTYHNKTPTFCEEIKIALPLLLSPDHHILFSFLHIGCWNTSRKRRKQPAEKIFAYAWLPLMPKNSACIIADGHHTLCVHTKISDRYLSGATEYLHGGGEIEAATEALTFTFNSKANTSLYPQDPVLGSIYRLFNECVDVSEDLVQQISYELHRILAAEIFDLVSQLPILLNIIFKNLKNSRNEIQFAAFYALVSTITNLKDRGGERCIKMLNEYIDFVFNFRDIHLSLVPLWIEALDPSRTPPSTIIRPSDILQHCEYLFKFLFKSMVLYLHATNKDFSNNRQGSFEPNFMEDLSRLFCALAREVKFRACSPQTLSESVNNSCGYFLSDLISVCDRGHTMAICVSYLSLVSPSHADSQTSKLKFQFLQIILAHEHSICLNLGVLTNIEKYLSVSFRETRSMCISQILILNAVDCLAQENPPDTEFPINLLCEQIERDIFNIRCVTKQFSNSVAGVYLTLPLKLSHCYEFLTRLEYENLKHLLFGLCVVLKEAGEVHISNFWKTLMQDEFGTNGFFQILSLCIDTYDTEKKERAGATEKDHLLLQEIGLTLLQCVENLKNNIIGLDVEETEDIFSSTNFDELTPGENSDEIPMKNSGENSDEKETAVRRESEAEKPVRRGSVTSRSGARRQSLTHLNLSVARPGGVNSPAGKPPVEFSNPQKKNNVLQLVFRLQLHLLSATTHGRLFLSCISSLSCLVGGYPAQFFSNKSSWCRSLSFQLLQSASLSGDTRAREQTAHLLYLLLKKNFSFLGNFTRMKVAGTTALSSLLSGVIYSEKNLNEIFAHILSLEERDTMFSSEKDKTYFHDEIVELINIFNSLLKDSLQVIREHNLGGNADLLSSLSYDVAKGYKHAPQLRMVWLDSMVKIHSQNLNFLEAAHALLEMCVQISECLAHLGESSALVPLRRNGFVSATTRTTPPGFELTFENKNLQNDLSQSHYFSQKFLLASLRKIIDFLERSEYYEMCGEVYKILIKYFDDLREWDKICSAHEHLANLYKKISECENHRVRDIALYYRVKFVGKGFECCDGNEMIYRENKFVRISEFQEKNEIFWKRRLGERNVEIIPQFNVDPTTLNPNKNYLQITAVDPFIADAEKYYQSLFLEKATGVNEFVIEKPYTHTGETYGTVQTQCKKKIILRVDGTFPGLLKRLSVVERREIDLSPIETATENIHRKCIELRSHVDAKIHDAKALQGVLQGCVKAMVNFGPAETCRVFLSQSAHTSSDPPPLADAKKLGKVMRSFLHETERAVNLNKFLIGPSDSSQLAFHGLLHDGLQDLKNEVLPHLEYIESV